MALHEVAQATELPPGEKLGVTVGEAEIALFNVDGTIYALEDCCPHQGARLSEVGHCRPGQVMCVLHGAVFDIETGEVLAPPAERDVRSFPVEVREGKIFVEV